MQVVMLQDWHGVEKSVERQIELLSKYSTKPEDTRIFHEPLPKSYHPDRFSAGNISLEQFWEKMRLEKHWGPSNPYKKLYRFLSEHGYWLGSLDHSREERTYLAEDFKKLVIRFRKGEDDDLSISRQFGFKRFDVLKRRLSFERELYFCKMVDEAKYSVPSFETVVVITHPAHINRCADYFTNTQGYSVEVADVDPQLAEELSKEEQELQLKFAEERKILEMETPPLVPIVNLAWTKVK